MASGERGMNPVAMTIINSRKEYWQSQGSNKRPPLFLNTSDRAIELSYWSISISMIVAINKYMRHAVKKRLNALGKTIHSCQPAQSWAGQPNKY